MLVSPRPAVSLGSRSLPTIGVRIIVCHGPCTGRIPLVPRVGFRSALIRGISSHEKNVTIGDFVFLEEKQN